MALYVVYRLELLNVLLIQARFQGEAERQQQRGNSRSCLELLCRIPSNWPQVWAFTRTCFSLLLITCLLTKICS